MSSFTLQVLQFNAHEVAQFEMRGKRFEVSINCLNVNENVDNIEGAWISKFQSPLVSISKQNFKRLETRDQSFKKAHKRCIITCSRSIFKFKSYN